MEFIELYGPTYFAPILAQFKNHIKANMASPIYHVLLIITDGCIHDFDATRAEIWELAALPCSLIIVGVGSDDLGMMYKLDGDDHNLVHPTTGQPACRDIVQFVEYQLAIHMGNLEE
jgi:hypothetical protein